MNHFFMIILLAIILAGGWFLYEEGRDGTQSVRVESSTSGLRAMD